MNRVESMAKNDIWSLSQWIYEYLRGLSGKHWFAQMTSVRFDQHWFTRNTLRILHTHTHRWVKSLLGQPFKRFNKRDNRVCCCNQISHLRCTIIIIILEIFHWNRYNSWNDYWLTASNDCREEIDDNQTGLVCSGSCKRTTNCGLHKPAAAHIGQPKWKVISNFCLHWNIRGKLPLYSAHNRKTCNFRNVHCHFMYIYIEYECLDDRWCPSIGNPVISVGVSSTTTSEW